MIVMKFGGTSVESAEAIQRVTGIVKSRLDRRPIVVVSAMGKTTNRLLKIADLAVSGHRDDALRELISLRDFHLRESGMERTVDEHFQELSELVKGLAVLGELTPRSIDAISSFGERLSSLIVTNYFQHHGLSAVHVDSRKMIVTDHRHTQAVPLFDQTYARLSTALPPLAKQHVVVMGGFIACTENGVTTTLGRGGSDFTASIVGAGIGAEEIQIWTDVDGMLTADPTVIPGAHRVKVISFTEAAELAYFGAKVLHPATVMPAIDRNIPVMILNSRRPQVEGTRIQSATVPSKNVVKSIACKGKVMVLNIRSTRMFMAHGFMRRIFEVFDRNQTSVDMVATSEVSVSLTIDQLERVDAIARELREFAEVSVDENQAIICIVGENIRHTPGVAARVFNALGSINVRMLSQGASSLNLGFVVAGADLSAAVQALHTEFFTDLDPAVFELSNQMPNLAIVGYGKMGRLIDQLAPEYGFTVTARVDVDRNESLEGADAAVEFSVPSAVLGNIQKVSALRIPIVIGTTAWLDHLAEAKAIVEANQSALVWSPNFSVGVNVFTRLVSEAARLLANEKEYGAWAWEIHHITKKDAPSGTLLQLVDKMKAAGYARNIDTSSSRAGAHPGTHEIGFDSAADTITLRHAARSREGFARGALKAAQWVIGRKGFYEFSDVLFGG